MDWRPLSGWRRSIGFRELLSILLSWLAMMNFLPRTLFAFAVVTLLGPILSVVVEPSLVQNRLLAQATLTEEEPEVVPEFGTEAQDTATAEEDEKSLLPKPLDRYMGRRIARTMHYTGAEWLIRDTRERQERCSLMLANLGVKPGMVICDMGCGNGFYSLQMAQMTGKNGYVVGVDVQPEMLSLLRERMEGEGVENIIPILGSFHDPRLPRNLMDMVLMVDVYHEFSHPEQMLASIRTSLKPEGVIVLVEYREEDPKVPIKPLHKMSKEQIHKEMNANGFTIVKEYDKLPWQHMMFFGKSDAPAKDLKSLNEESSSK